MRERNFYQSDHIASYWFENIMKLNNFLLISPLQSLMWFSGTLPQVALLFLLWNSKEASWWLQINLDPTDHSPDLGMWIGCSKQLIRHCWHVEETLQTTSSSEKSLNKKCKAVRTSMWSVNQFDRYISIWNIRECCCILHPFSSLDVTISVEATANNWMPMLSTAGSLECCTTDGLVSTLCG